MTSQLPAGLLVLGTEPACGKTVLLTGLTAVLQQEGFEARAIKPITIGTAHSCEPELAFISKITASPLNYPIQFIERVGELSQPGWLEAIKTCRCDIDAVVVELPGSCASPIAKPEATGMSFLDCADFAGELGWPCLVVAKAGADALEKLLLNVSYLAVRKLQVVGMVIVETRTGLDDWVLSNSMEIALQEKTGVPFLGVIKHSPSISVQPLNQGNLIKTTSAALDLLPIIKALNFRISV